MWGKVRLRIGPSEGGSVGLWFSVLVCMHTFSEFLLAMWMVDSYGGIPSSNAHAGRSVRECGGGK